MTQVTSGIRKALEIPSIYSLFQRAIGGQAATDVLLSDYIKLADGMRVLDIGCGPGDLLGHVTEDIEYYGVDFEPAYIEKARARHGTRGHFICEDVSALSLGADEKFDRVLVIALLHHLDDDRVRYLTQTLSRLLKPGGMLFSLENVFVPEQSYLARKIIEGDRGQNVRTVEGYIALLQPFFTRVKHEVRQDLLRIPYTHLLTSCYR